MDRLKDDLFPILHPLSYPSPASDHPNERTSPVYEGDDGRRTHTKGDFASIV